MSRTFTHARPAGSQPMASGSKPRTGSKLKHTLAIAASAFSSPATSAPSTGVKASRRSKRPLPESDDEGEDEAVSGGSDGDSGEEGRDTDDEISAAQGARGSKKQKTKRKAPTTASMFGSTLTSLLAEPGPGPSASRSSPTTKTKAGAQQPILALSRAPLPPGKEKVNLERKAARIIKQEKAEREDRARVRNVIEGWTPAPPIVRGPGAAEGVGSQEFEKGLRKTAQRGVIKLFNAILAASKAAEEQDLSLSARAGVKAEHGKRKEKDNVLGRGGREELTKEGFLELVKKGGAR